MVELVAILLLNVMKVFSVGGGALLDRQCVVFHRMCIRVVSVPSVHISVPSIGLDYVLYVGSYLLI